MLQRFVVRPQNNLQSLGTSLGNDQSRSILENSHLFSMEIPGFDGIFHGFPFNDFRVCHVSGIHGQGWHGPSWPASSSCGICVLPGVWVCGRELNPRPIGSMYAIYANIWGIFMVNVTIYSSTMDPVVGLD
jgi:hypothetical protein